MDKLELDARVARLERRVSLLMALMVSLLVLLAVPALLLFFGTSPCRASLTVTTPAPPPAALPADVASMHRLDAELRKLQGLSSANLIERDDFQAKKKQVFAPILHAADFAEDMKLAKKLLDENIIERAEYGELKKKILEIGR